MTNNAEREAFEKWYATDEAWGETPKELAWRTWQAHAQASGVPDGWQEALEKVAQEWDCHWEDAKDFFFDAIRVWRPDDTHLLIARDELISRDDYGEYGSDFYICKLCGEESGAGVLNKGIEHEASCRLNPINYAPTPPKSASVPVERLEAFISQHGADATHACDEYEVLASLKELIAEYKALPLSEVE